MATLISQIKGIVTGHNNSGVKVLWAVEQSIDHMFAHNDWTPLAWLLAKMEPKTDQGLLRRIVGECVGGVTLVSKGKLAKDQPSGLFIKRAANADVTEKMAILRKLVADGESFRGKAVREQLLEKPDPVFDLHTFIKRMVKKIETEGFSLDQALKEIAAVEKEETVIDVTKPEAADKKVKVG